MSWTKWTQMRHLMLAAVDAGAVRDVGGQWQFASRPSTKAQMSRACNWLWDAGALHVVTAGRAALTADGRRLLDDWNARHPEVAS